MQQAQLEYNKTKFKYQKVKEITLSSLTLTNRNGSTDVADKVRLPYGVICEILTLCLFLQLCNYVEVHAKFCEALSQKIAALESQMLKYRSSIQEEKEQLHLQLEEERKKEQMKKQSLLEEQKKFKKEFGKEVNIFRISPEAIMQRGGSTEDGVPKIIHELIVFLERKGTVQYLLPVANLSSKRPYNWECSGLQGLPRCCEKL